MKKLLFILFIIPLISFSQNNDFLTKLFLDSVEIKNQEFKLKLAGVINTKAQKIDKKYDDIYISEILFLDDLRVSQQFKSEVFLGNRTDVNKQDFIDKCTWNWTKKNPNLKMVSPSSLDYFPTFSFLKGKLLTVIDIDSVSKDYLFSVSKSEDYENYGHKTLKFNLTDDNEKGYTIKTIIINEQSYIIFDKDEMSALGFDTKFVNESKFKVICDGIDRTRHTSYSDNYFSNCLCKCEANYLSIYRKKTKYMKNTYNFDEDDLLYLFKLEKKNI